MRIVAPLIVCLGLASCASVASSDAEPARPPAVFSGIIPPLLVETQVPSVAIGRVESGTPTWVGAWGVRSAGVPATADTLYNVASLTKPVSAETVLRAASRGLLALDEPLSSAWIDPDIADDARHRRLTAKLALTHRTGFPNWRYQTGDRLVFQNEPGTVGYSGEGFEYLARFVERRLDRPFDSLADELVFGPVGMTDTAYVRREDFAGRLAMPHDEAGRPLDLEGQGSVLASDNLHTTAGDYARLLASIARGEGLSAELARARQTVLADTRADECRNIPGAACPDQIGWGLGWTVLVFGDERILAHSGADRGEFSFAFIDLTTGEGAVILTNSGAGYKIMLPIMEQLTPSPRFLAYLRAKAGG